jgi:MFS family permease
MSPGSSPFAALKHRNFARFALAMAVSSAGQFLIGLTTPFLMNRLTESSAWVGASGFLALAPAVVGTPLAGALADRVDRHRMLLVTFVCLVVLDVVFLVGYLTDGLTPWRILGLQLVLGSLTGFQFAPIQSMPAVLVPAESLVDAVRFMSIVFTASRAIGPAIGGVVLATAGPGLGYGLTTAFFVAGLLGLLTVRTTQKVVTSESRILVDLREGIRYIAARSGMRLAVASSFMVGMCGASIAFPLAPSVAAEQFGAGGAGLGVLATMIGVGSICGSIFISRGGGRVLRSRVEMAALLAYSCGVLVLGATHALGVGIVGYFAIGAAHMLHNVSMTTSLQVQVTEEFRGRVMGVWLVALMAGVPLGALGGGFLASATSMAVTVTVFGSALALYTLVAAVRTGAMRSLDDQLPEFG